MNTITVEDYRKLRSAKTPHVLIDVREQDEWDAGHIEDAVLLPLGTVEEKIGEVAPDKSAMIVMHCARGGRSAKACGMLDRMGYTNVNNLEGGYNAYSAV